MVANPNSEWARYAEHCADRRVLAERCVAARRWRLAAATPTTPTWFWEERHARRAGRLAGAIQRRLFRALDALVDRGLGALAERLAADVLRRIEAVPVAIGGPVAYPARFDADREAEQARWLDHVGHVGI